MMNDNPLDKSTATALAAVVHAVRDDWDERGIVAALAKVRARPLWQTSIAAVLAARNPDARTPEVIALAGDHWKALDASVTSPAERHPSAAPIAALCAVCGRQRGHCENSPRLEDNHQYTPTRSYDPTRGGYPPAHRRAELDAARAQIRAVNESRRNEGDL